LIHFICINKYRLIEKVLICGVWWVKFPKLPYSDDYFLIGYHITGLSDLGGFFFLFLGLSIQYSR